MAEPGANPRRIPPGLIAIAVALVIAGSVFNNWHREALLAALRESVLTVAIVAGLLAILAAIEILLHGRVRLWGRSVVSRSCRGSSCGDYLTAAARSSPRSRESPG
jgi:hypothetical protein